MTNKIKALFIDPDEKKVETIELDENQNDIDLDQCYDIMDCELVEFVYFGNKEILIVDEEGLLKDKEPFKLEGVGQQYFVGKALIVQEKGERCVGLSDNQIAKLMNKISFPDLEEE